MYFEFQKGTPCSQCVFVHLEECDAGEVSVDRFQSVSGYTHTHTLLFGRVNLAGTLKPPYTTTFICICDRGYQLRGLSHPSTPWPTTFVVGLGVRGYT